MTSPATPINITVVIQPRMNGMPFFVPRSVASTRLNAMRLNGEAAAVRARTASVPSVEEFIVRNRHSARRSSDGARRCVDAFAGQQVLLVEDVEECKGGKDGHRRQGEDDEHGLQRARRRR